MNSLNVDPTNIEDVIIKFSDPGMQPCTVKCEPWKVSKELETQSEYYTTAIIEVSNKSYTMRRFAGDSVWLPEELFLLAAYSFPTSETL